MEIRNTAEEIRNTGQLSEENEQRIAFKIGWQSATRRNGLVTTRDGLLARIQKHGVSWKGDYFDEGVFAGPKGLKGIPDSTISLQQSVPELRRQKFVVAASQLDATVMGSDFNWIKSCTGSEGRVVKSFLLSQEVPSPIGLARVVNVQFCPFSLCCRLVASGVSSVVALRGTRVPEQGLPFADSPDQKQARTIGPKPIAQCDVTRLEGPLGRCILAWRGPAPRA